MRISDWSSDVCSSDLADHVVQGLLALGEGDHQVADAQQDGAEDGGEVAREPAPETAARAVAADDLDPDRHLARRGLVGGGIEPAVVAGAEYQRDQLHHQLDGGQAAAVEVDRKSTRLNSSH